MGSGEPREQPLRRNQIPHQSSRPRLSLQLVDASPTVKGIVQLAGDWGNRCVSDRAGAGDEGAHGHCWHYLAVLPGDKSWQTLDKAAVGLGNETGKLRDVRPAVTSRGGLVKSPEEVEQLEQGRPLWSHAPARRPTGTQTDKEPHRSTRWAAAWRASRRTPGPSLAGHRS
jgi:hypothetical protein